MFSSFGRRLLIVSMNAESFIASSKQMMKFTYEGSHLTWTQRLINDSQISDFQFSIWMRNHEKNKTTERTPDVIWRWAHSLLIYQDETIIHLTLMVGTRRKDKSSDSKKYPLSLTPFRDTSKMYPITSMKDENLPHNDCEKRTQTRRAVRG